MALSFDATYYLNARPDVFHAFVATAGATGKTWPEFAEEHYNTYGRFEGANPNATFNTDEYLAANPDVAAAGVNPFTHYLYFGVNEGRAPNDRFPAREDFDHATYLAANPDLGEAGIDTAEEAYAHFVIFGQFEGRPGTPDIDNGIPGTTQSLTVNQDNLNGTANNDVFNAGAAQDGAGNLINTLQNVDVLDGGAGVDTLNVTLAEAAAVAASISNIENVNVRFADAGADLSLTNATGVAAINVASSTTAGTVSGVASVASLSVRNQNHNVAFDGSTAATLALSLDTFGKSTASNTIDLGTAVAAKATTLNATLNNSYATLDSTQADAIQTLSIAATGSNKLSLVDSGNDVKTAVVTGTGSVDLTGTALTGALTSFDASGNAGGVKVNIQSTAKADVKGGSGNDVVDMDTAVVADTTVALGAGNDALYVGALLGSFKSVDGGEGTDIINITDGATYTKANVAKIANFEVLDVSGGKALYDLGLKSFDTVQVDEAVNGALTGALTLSNAGAGFAFNVISKAGTNANFALGAAQTIALKDDTGASDVVNLNVTIKDGNNDAATDGNVTFSTSTTIAGVESININSVVATPDKDVKASAYTTTFTDLIAADVKTLTITGDSSVVFTALTNANNTLTKVDASTSTGNVTLDASGIASQVAYIGAVGVDTYKATDGGSIYGGAGNDLITLAAAGKADTIIYKSASDVSFADANVDGKIDAAGGIETITGFTTAASAGVNEADVIDLSSFGFSGYASGAGVNKGALATGVESGTFDFAIADFFADAAGDRAVAFGTDGGATYVFVDIDGDGNWNAGADLAIKLAGVANFSVNDITF